MLCVLKSPSRIYSSSRVCCWYRIVACRSWFYVVTLLRLLFTCRIQKHRGFGSVTWREQHINRYHEPHTRCLTTKYPTRARTFVEAQHSHVQSVKLWTAVSIGCTAIQSPPALHGCCYISLQRRGVTRGTNRYNTCHCQWGRSGDGGVKRGKMHCKRLSEDSERVCWDSDNVTTIGDAVFFADAEITSCAHTAWNTRWHVTVNKQESEQDTKQNGFTAEYLATFFVS